MSDSVLLRFKCFHFEDLADFRRVNFLLGETWKWPSSDFGIRTCLGLREVINNFAIQLSSLQLPFAVEQLLVFQDFHGGHVAFEYPPQKMVGVRKSFLRVFQLSFVHPNFFSTNRFSLGSDSDSELDFPAVSHGCNHRRG